MGSIVCGAHTIIYVAYNIHHIIKHSYFTYNVSTSNRSTIWMHLGPNFPTSIHSICLYTNTPIYFLFLKTPTCKINKMFNLFKLYDKAILKSTKK